MTSPYTNQLIHETSPYLLQHAHNPVSWYAWGPEALGKAKAENKPILLSIGYSACHWCHVMERESFEDEQIAALMNEHFVNIKVDREERPDLDHIYQAAIQMITGQGGWPLTAFLTPDQEVFYGGTYFPPDDRYGRPGFRRMLQSIAAAYHQRQDDVVRSVTQIRDGLQQISAVEDGPGALTPALLENAARALANQVDMTHGGFGSQPKFPNPTNIEYLLRFWHGADNANFLHLAKLTLDKMAQGGIYDQLGGGFHRYSTDAHWLAPHFEKMLYDNAQLLPLYLSMYQITQEPTYARVARETLAYIKREMTHPDGGFYATQDADSEGEEGKFFVWKKVEIDALLGSDARLFCRYYDITDTGNWERGANIPHLTVTLNQLAAMFNQEPEATAARIAQAKTVVFEAREQRVKPFRDEKILTAWNGLMISGMARVYTVLGDAEALDIARRAIAFLQRHMLRDGRLLRTYKDGQAKLDAYLDDYAFFSAALLDVFEATFDRAYFELASSLTATLLDEFWDEEFGGFFFTGKHHEALITRTKSAFDQAIPSGNAVAAKTLLRLYHLTGRDDYLQRAERVLSLYAPQMERQAFGLGAMLNTLDFYLRKPYEIALIGDPAAADTQALLGAIRAQYLPNQIIIHLDPQRLEADLDALPPLRDLLTGKSQVGSRATAYVCRDFTCSLPMTEPADLAAYLGARSD